MFLFFYVISIFPSAFPSLFMELSTVFPPGSMYICQTLNIRLGILSLLSVAFREDVITLALHHNILLFPLTNHIADTIVFLQQE